LLSIGLVIKGLYTFYVDDVTFPSFQPHSRQGEDIQSGILKKAQIPNHKFQINSKLQYQNESLFWSFVFEI